jgi:hypothetical protein
MKHYEARFKKEIAEAKQAAKVYKDLYEGLIYTYPSGSSARMVKAYFAKEYDISLDVEALNTSNTKNNINTKIQISVFDQEEENHDKVYKMIESYMDSLGYFISQSSSHEDLSPFPTLEIIFDLKYSDVETNHDRYLFHAAPKIYDNKIDKMGLVPKAKNKLAKTLDRIYLAVSLEEVENISKLLQAHTSMVDTKWDTNEYTIYKVDTEKIPGFKCFHDPDFAKGVYTYNNIGPEALELVLESE